MSSAGISRLQTEAATITPAAKPVSARWVFRRRLFFIRKTHAAPRDVPKKGINKPMTVSFMAVCLTSAVVFFVVS